MNYKSTRDASLRLSGAEVIARGLSAEGGLFVPERIPALRDGQLDALCEMDYPDRAAKIIGMYLEDYTPEELRLAARSAYGAQFDGPAAPLRALDGDTWFLELWHGPTCAFKDMALQILPRLLTMALRKTGEEKDVCILVATSGDTGKAALEGFRDVEHTKIQVFYPMDGVSDIQKLQMQTQPGANVDVCGVHGNFDDAQNGVKAIFRDEDLRAKLAERGWFLSSANSINWGRLLPQIVYYISAYCDLRNSGAIRPGQSIDFCVPTGNFGDILAGHYARRMGLPVGKLLCASNRNDVLTEFLRTGCYDRNRPFYTTVSPSMDILVSSNLERLLFDLSGQDDDQVEEYMRLLSTVGKYTVDSQLRGRIEERFLAGSCGDGETRAAIGRVWREHRYLMDTHTAVAYQVLEAYRARCEKNTPTVVVSTASPFKFCEAVLEALGESTQGSGLELLDRLETVTGIPAPAPLKTLRGRSVRFADYTEREQMRNTVERFLM